VVALLVVLVVGMVALGMWVLRLSRRFRSGLGAGPRSVELLPSQVIDIDSLTSWVLSHLPRAIAGSLDADDIRRIVTWHLDFVRSKRASTNGNASKPARHVIVAGAETAEYVLERASAEGLSYTPAQVHAVLDAQVAYLESIGAAEQPGEGT
jgi:hypothetical protein